MAPPISMDLPSLVDLAIGAPEMGAVNFNILHTILHVIIHQLNLGDVIVKFKPEDSGKIKTLLATAPRGKIVKLTESIQTVGTSGHEKPLPTNKFIEIDNKSEDDTLRRSVEKVTKTVKKIKKKLQDLPSNEELLERSRSSSGTPLNDTLQLVNLNKRMDAAEASLKVLSSMMESLAKGGKSSISSKGPIDDAGAAVAYGVDVDVCTRLDDVERRVTELEKGGRRRSNKSPSDTGEGKPDQNYNELVTRLDDHETRIKKITTITDSLPIDNICTTVKEFEQMKIRVGEMSAMVMAHEELNFDPKRFEEIALKADEASSHMNDTDKRLTTALELLQKQLDELEKEQGEVVEKVGTLTGKANEEPDEDMSGLAELYTKIQMMQSDMDSLATTANRLLDDREQQDLHMSALSEELDVLKMIKADKEDLEDALAEKADQLVVNRKVSHDQFDAACDDLSRSLEEAISKISQQEIIWQQALDDIQLEMDSKLDKTAVHPLKEFVNNKLTSLQERLKQLAAIRRDQEAAAVKKRLIRNVTCLSCDKDVAIKRESDIPSMPGHPPMPPTRSIKPYLSYELDVIRKEEKRLAYGRNMNQFAQAMKDARRHHKISQQDIGLHGLHLCNRYCGGSHTITTPQQRVTRIGHFLQQWGPEALSYPKEKEKEKEKLPRKVSRPSAEKGKPLVAVEESSEEEEMGIGSSIGEITVETPRTSTQRGSVRSSKRTSTTKRTSKKESTTPAVPSPSGSIDEMGEPITAIEDMEASETSIEDVASAEGIIEDVVGGLEDVMEQDAQEGEAPKEEEAQAEAEETSPPAEGEPAAESGEPSPAQEAPEAEPAEAEEAAPE